MTWWQRLVSSRVQSDPVQLDIHYGRSLQELVRRLKKVEHPRLLDLGFTSGSNIDFFHRQGCKVHVDDFTSSLMNRPMIVRDDEENTTHQTRSTGEAKKAAPRPVNLPPLDYGDAQFDAILGWDLFDYLEEDEAAAMAAEIDRVTRPGGWLLALFGPARQEQPRQARRYHIEEENRVRGENVAGASIKIHHYANRDIARLFRKYEISHTVLLKDGTREILLKKHSRRPSGSGEPRMVNLV